MTADGWIPDDQEQWLRELLGDAREEKEAPLRRDVRTLGQLLGDAIRAQDGEALFETIEELRGLTTAHREGGAARLEQAIARVAALPVDDVYQLARAFAFYFELTNLAETNHRKRRRRAGEIQGSVQPGDIRGTFQRMRTADSLRRKRAPRWPKY
jgi:phosphoenolpyruvate carboxylase